MQYCHAMEKAPMKISYEEQAFLERNQLPLSYLEAANQWFSPIVDSIVHSYNPDKSPKVIGINGCQGSGKSTLADYLCTVVADCLDITTVSLSLDDFYLTKSDRLNLGTTIHPLLETRGVPGTHDVPLAMDCISRLSTGKKTVITRFDKSIDDRASAEILKTIEGKIGLIVLEGWCLGALPESPDDLIQPINSLEENDDRDGIWRHYVNQAILNDYQPLFNLVDELIMLQAPSFDTVFNWRLEQEQKMIKRLQKEGIESRSGIMTEQQILRFISFFQRVTENILKEMPNRADHLFKLGLSREITQYSRPTLP
jgi:D-glycerate 3-kinase